MWVYSASFRGREADTQPVFSENGLKIVNSRPSTIQKNDKIAFIREKFFLVQTFLFFFYKLKKECFSSRKPTSTAFIKVKHKPQLARMSLEGSDDLLLRGHVNLVIKGVG